MKTKHGLAGFFLNLGYAYCWVLLVDLIHAVLADSPVVHDLGDAIKGWFLLEY